MSHAFIKNKENLEISYFYAHLENLAPNCDSAMIFTRNNVKFYKRRCFFEQPTVHLLGFVKGVNQGCQLYPYDYNINGRTDILMYLRPECFSENKDVLDLIENKCKNDIPEFVKIRNKIAYKMLVSFQKLSGVFFIDVSKEKISGYEVYKDNTSGHAPKPPDFISIADAYLENRTLNCDSAYIYSKRNIKPLKVNSKTSSFSKIAKAKIYIPGIDPSHSKHENLEKAQLERLFIRLNCLVGISSSEIFDLFCIPNEIEVYKKWEKTWSLRKKRLEVKFKGFPSKGIFVEFNDGMVVESGMIE